jgi:hypothetical protein
MEQAAPRILWFGTFKEYTMMKQWMIALAVCGIGLLVGTGEADALGLCHRDCAPPCPPPPPPPPIKLVLQVCHPCTGCKIEIPVCLPACCIGEPCVRFQDTIIGEGKTVFEWKCGHKVVVRYTHSGGYHVHERG